MKKLITKFWGVGLIVILLSTMFVGSVPQAAANDYAFSYDTTLPSVVNGVLDYMGTGDWNFNDVAQSGATIYSVVSSTVAPATVVNFVMTSPNGGGFWYPVDGTGLPSMTTGNLTLVAVAPDDPNFVAVVDTTPATDVVYLSTNGGALFTALTALSTNATLTSIAISGLTDYHYLAVGGSINATSGLGDSSFVNPGFLKTWTIKATAPAWVTPGSANLLITVNPPINAANVTALAYSPSFSSGDEALLVVTANASSVYLHAYSYMFDDWDTGFLTTTTFPRMLEGGTTLNCVRASITLDTALPFDMSDESTQVGFIGASITRSGTEIGGVYRIGTYITANYTMTQILDNTAINSVGWDGTNLMAAKYDAVPGDALVVYRCANALSTLTSIDFSGASATYKTLGTGYDPLVFFNAASGYGYALSRGHNSAVAMTTDYGKTFNGIALVNSNFNTIRDSWVSPDGARVYVLADDGTDLNLWRKSGTTWERVFIYAGQTGTTWLVRADAGNPDAVYLGKQGTKSMFKSVDAGEAVWSSRSCTQLIQDFAVQDTSTVYVAVQGALTVVTSKTGASGWLTPVSTYMNLYSMASTCYSITLIADDQLLVGGTAGGVAYSVNGNTSWTALPALGASRTLVTATTTNGIISDGDTIWAASNTTAQSIGRWHIGTSTSITGWERSASGSCNFTGLVYANAVLYAYDSYLGLVDRYYAPATYGDLNAFGAFMTVERLTGAPVNLAPPTSINTLQASTGSTVLWAISASTPDLLDSYTEYLGGTVVAPVSLISPANGAVIPVNSINGIVTNFLFRWNAPAATAVSQYYTFYLMIFDSSFADVVGFVMNIGGAYGGSTGAYSMGSIAGFIPVPGETYWWMVGTFAPVASQWSVPQSFTIQQLTAIVPVITSPENGGSVSTVFPAFSWTPISGATSYSFELSLSADFATTVYAATTASAGAGVPAGTPLSRGMQYYWRVKALTPTEGEWSAVGNFMVAQLPTTTPAVTITTQPASTIILTQTQPPATTVTQVTEEKVINPTYIWAIIIIGAVLVIAVIVLIVRTRRSV